MPGQSALTVCARSLGTLMSAELKDNRQPVRRTRLRLSRGTSGSALLMLALSQALYAQAQEEAAPPPRVTVEILGVEEDVAGSVRRAVELRALANRPSASEALIRRLHERAPEQIMRALEPYGWYSAQIEPLLEVRPDNGYAAQYRITLGEPTKVTAVNIEVAEAAENRRVARSIRRFRPKIGEVLNHPTYEGSKAKVFQALVSEGYLEAELKQAQVAVTRAERSADIKLVFSPGQRYALGQTRFVGSHVDEKRLARLVPFEAGDEYRLSKLLELQRRITDTGYFSIVDVAPDVENLGEASVPVEVRLEPGTRTAYRAGLFFGTDSGPGVRGSVERRWMNHRGDQMRIEAELSDKFNYGAVVYSVPLDRPGRPILEGAARISDRITDTSESKQTSLSLTYRGKWRDWQHALSLNLLDGDFEVGDEPGESTLFYPELKARRSTLRPASDPRRGYSLDLTLRAAPGGLGSDTNFVQGLAQLRWVLPRGKSRDRIILRGDLGATYVGDFDKLPPDLRFFAGGDRSIRGFGFQELGPENDLGKVRGGRFLAMASAEYERRLSGPWAAAGFVDVGNAFDTGQFDPVVSVGAGARWRGPIGLVRLDLGVGVSEPDTPIRLHLIIGSEL